MTIGFVLVGAVVLGLSLRIDPGSPWFYPATLGLAGVWAVGAFCSGPLHLGRIARRASWSGPVDTRSRSGPGWPLSSSSAPCWCASCPSSSGQVSSVIDYADQGSLPLLVVITAVNGIAEELFFRGAAYAAIPRHPVLWTTVAYGVATLATGNVMLSFAAVLLGVVVGLERRASGGILAPILTHCTWSLTMLLVLPLVFGA